MRDVHGSLCPDTPRHEGHLVGVHGVHGVHGYKNYLVKVCIRCTPACTPACTPGTPQTLARCGATPPFLDRGPCRGTARLCLAPRWLSQQDMAFGGQLGQQDMDNAYYLRPGAVANGASGRDLPSGATSLAASFHKIITQGPFNTGPGPPCGGGTRRPCSFVRDALSLTGGRDVPLWPGGHRHGQCPDTAGKWPRSGQRLGTGEGVAAVVGEVVKPGAGQVLYARSGQRLAGVGRPCGSASVNHGAGVRGG